MDRVARKRCGSFVLVERPEEPGSPEVERPYSAQQVFEWLREFPWQIERTVIANEAAPQCPAIQYGLWSWSSRGMYGAAI